MRDETAARVVAAMAAANGPLKDCQLRALAELDAFRRLGVRRDRFVVLAREALGAMGERLDEPGWLSTRDLQYLDPLLIAVEDRALQMLACRLTAAVITADGHIGDHERSAYDHMLACWHVTPSMVSQAILADPVTV
jgi:hypothetical protein